MLIAVTGASGAIGRALRWRLSTQSDTPARYFSRNIYSGPDYVRGPDLSVASIGDWIPVLAGVSTLIHLAALLPSSRANAGRFEAVNVKGTEVLAQAAAEVGVERFVFVSTLGVHGITSGSCPFSPQSPIVPSSAYAESKYRAEGVVSELCSRTGMQCVIARPPVVYGSGVGGGVAKLSKLIARNRRLPFGRIDQNRRQMISARNLADGLLLSAAHAEAPGSALLFSDQEAVSTHDLLAKLARLHNRDLRYLPIPEQLLELGQKIPILGKSVERLTGNVEIRDMRLRNQLGWTAPHRLEEELADMIQGRAER